MSRVYQVGCRANAWRGDGTVAEYMLDVEHVPLEDDHGEPVESIEEALSYTEADAEDEVSRAVYGQRPGYEYHLYQWTDEAGYAQTIALALDDDGLSIHADAQTVAQVLADIDTDQD